MHLVVTNVSEQVIFGALINGTINHQPLLTAQRLSWENVVLTQWLENMYYQVELLIKLLLILLIAHLSIQIHLQIQWLHQMWQLFGALIILQFRN
jgi:hypothetical protein